METKADNMPSLEEFLTLPIEEVIPLAPQTMVYYVSGSRRGAALDGVGTSGEAYKHWASKEMMRCVSLLFDYGIKHLLMPMVTPGSFSEITSGYREFLWNWIDWGLAREEAIEFFIQQGWHVHIPFGEHIPELKNVIEQLKVTTQFPKKSSLWIFIVPEQNILWEWALAKLQAKPVTNTQAAVKLLYGEEIPLATLYLDFGKPIISSDLLPPFLIGKLESYWSQEPGYSLNDQLFRRILYDFAFIRKTWMEDKSGRAEQAIEYRNAWEGGVVLGLGERLGPFWYPQPTTNPKITTGPNSNDQKE
ncbi:MAG: hypothetical protein H6668_07985 [Ardenticatenaceae bacterium]|nr:hypothetical protein [Ardenticatenaceae bacterium]